MKRLFVVGALLLASSACATKSDAPAPGAAPAPATTAAASPAPAAAPAAAELPPIVHTDYSRDENWLCKPGKANNACDANIDATIIKADGSTSVEKFKADPDAPIDCFYIYPTVSLDPFTESDLIPGPEELSVVKTQFERLGAKCRLYAPMYRQFSLGALRARMSGGGAVPSRGNPGDGTADVDDAWAYYLAHENNGRGVVIVGHSQGSGQITRLIATHIDGKPVQSQLVSAIIMGTAFQIPPGKDVGGSFKSIPVCRTDNQFGCVVTFSSFRDTVPPGERALFGGTRPGTASACTNPAAMTGGVAKSPKAYFSTGTKEWVPGKKIDTPFVMTPGLITTECVSKDGHTYLQVHINDNPGDVRTRDPLTDVVTNGEPDPNWGLHLIDANLGIGDLVDLVGRQSEAYRKVHR
ncbi:MAG: DUF3089 domain-containing protein [Alphaproteobacteria bacterium]|nr:DUF3089 domain-containing protein [Alphaproteobacteria bacterium]